MPESYGRIREFIDGRETPLDWVYTLCVNCGCNFGDHNGWDCLDGRASWMASDSEFEVMWIPVTEVKVGDVVLNYRDRRGVNLWPDDLRGDSEHRIARIESRGGDHVAFYNTMYRIYDRRDLTHAKVLRTSPPAWANAGMAKRFEDLVKSLTSSPVS